jgi:hypothetical protein
MNAFQEGCWLRCERLLRETNTPFSGPTRVDGRRETYFIVQFPRSSDIVELFIYADEAGVMTNGKKWAILEAADFDTSDELIDAFVQQVSKTLKGR